MKITNIDQSFDYQILKRAVEKAERKIKQYTSDPFATNAELQQAENRLNEYIRNISRLKEEINNMPLNSERGKKAKQHCKKGDYQKARNVLDASEMCQEQHNLLILQKQQDIVEKLNDLTGEFILKAMLTAVDYQLGDQRIQQSCQYFEQALESSRAPEYLFYYALFLQEYNKFSDAEALYREALAVFRELAKIKPAVYLTKISDTLDNLCNIMTEKGCPYNEIESLCHEVTITFPELKPILREQIIDRHVRSSQKFILGHRAPRVHIAYPLEGFFGSQKEEKIEFAVFSPHSIERGSKFVLDVWAYPQGEYHTVVGLANEIGRTNLLGIKHGIHIRHDALLTISVKIDSLKVEEAIETLLWEGDPTNISYIVNVPSNIPIGQFSGKTMVSYKGIVMATIKFIITVADTKSHEYVNSSHDQFYPKTAFASYASENRADVLSRIHGMKKVAPELDIFLDVFVLRSGEDWVQKLEEHVPNKDIFYLFWSHFSANSKWVEREWRLALSKRGLNYINPVPLEDIKIAPPPPELADLHFHDAYVAYIQYEKLTTSHTIS